MLKHRSREFKRTMGYLSLCLLVSCGICFTSCKDDYKYDNSEPSWLGSSIYTFLVESGNYTNYVKIIDDLNYKEVLNRTGSKTLFVADDAAFTKFFASNKWGVTKYADLTTAQKKIILYNSMLDNAYLLDMMSSLAGDPPQEGSCLRQTSSASVLDSVPFLTNENLPQNNKYWDAYRATGIRVMCDGTDPMMLHFLKEYLTTKAITDEDFAIIFNRQKTRSGNEAFIYGNKVLASGISYDQYSDDTLTITCKNGYVYRMDGVLVPPSNMAEELRNNPKTQIFSRMLDRFSVPVYSATLTSDYNRLYHPDDADHNEKVYQKRYFSSHAARSFLSFNDEDNKTISVDATAALTFDPGWNQYQPSVQTTAQEDMGAMFVPNDDVLSTYFTSGGGKFLIDRYGGPHYGQNWPLEQSLDSVPITIIQAFLTNLMKTSFSASVPSKFDKITNDARDPMGITTSTVDECMLANNGVVYILNTVFGPAKYVAVSAPPLVQENMRIINFAITSSSYLLNYNSYLLAMDSYFSFVVPDDKYFTYFDPVTLEQDDHVAYKFRYGRPTASATKDVVWAIKATYDPSTYEITNDSVGVITYTSNSALIENRLHDLMEYFIVVGNFEDGNQYYLTKGYGTIKVKNPGATGMQIMGGEQIENGRPVNVLQIYDQTEAGNGKTYLTDALPTPPTKSVYTRLANTPDFSEFFDLCNIEVDSICYYAFPGDKFMADSIGKYSIFYKEPKNNNGRDFNVPFFSTYHYTVYIPDNQAMEDAYTAGLPRPDFWKEIVTDTTVSAEKIAAELRQVNKFLRYHFQDNSVFVDTKPFSIVEAGTTLYTVNYETASLNENTGRFYNLTLKTENGTLTVTDQMGNIHEVQNDAKTEGSLYNIMARDLTYNSNDPKKASNIETSSFATIHLISGVLLNDGVGYKDNKGNFKYYTYTKDGKLSAKSLAALKTRRIATSYSTGWRTGAYASSSYDTKAIMPGHWNMKYWQKRK